MADENAAGFDHLVDPANEPATWEGPSFDPRKYTVEELQTKMAVAEFEFHFATKKLEEMQVQKTVREMKAKVIMASQSCSGELSEYWLNLRPVL